MYTNYNMNNVKKTNWLHGYHFFDKDAIRFFRSQTHGRATTVKYTVYFITSEQPIGSDGTIFPRMYSIRKMNANPTSGRYGYINTVGRFRAYSTFSEASKRLQDILRKEG